MKKLYAAFLVAVVALALSATAAFAAVTFDPVTGQGFVGKGDVQLAFGWNNTQLQKNASGVSFSYSATDEYEAVCRFVTGEGTRGERTHTPTRTRTTSVNSNIAYDARVKNQITGFNLTGLGTTTTSGDPVPVVGESCPGGGADDGTWISVTKTSSSGGLYVKYGGNNVLLQ